jgi:DNA-binding Xre family transcriptional regulator
MTLNERRQDLIGLAMYKNKVNKVQLSEALNLSYPTMLNKLNNPGNFRLNELDRLCDFLNIDVTELLINKI